MKNIFTKTIITKIKLNDEEFILEIIYKKVKHLYLHYKPLNKISVSCPLFTKYKHIEDFILSQQNWLFKQKKKYLQKKTNSYLITDKDHYYWWGILLEKDFNFNENDLQIKIYNQLQSATQELLPNYLNYLNKYGYQGYPSVEFATYKSKWGSCQPLKNIIRLNLKLIAFPKQCLALVLAHECVHFLVSRHDKNFYWHLNNLVPDYKQSKKLLR